MKARHFLGLGMLALLTACSGAKQKTENPVITVSGGQIQGVVNDSAGVVIYRGIPYAAPPVGALRWKRPQPVEPWQGVRTTDRWGNASLQADHLPGQFYTKEFFFGGDAERSEDCLYLNVWTPREAAGDTQARLPVAMWIHGGAYTGGWGHEITMDGEAWAQRGVILVTINYRLGIMGFLSHPALSAEDERGVSGNYGTYDQLAALQWVRDNIAQFGGNPDDITILGQSAGAASIKNLCASPLSKGLISKAIIQSIGGIGEMISVRTQEEAEAQGKAAMDAGGFTSLEQMRAANPEQLTEAVNAYNKQGGRLGTSPHLDGYLMAKDFTVATTDNTVADIPYMIGSTLDDMKGIEGSIMRFAQVRDSLSQQPVYVYRFDRRLPGDDAGAYHSSELWYIFHTLKNSWRPFTKADYELSDYMVDCWTNFAKHGNPDGAWRRATREDPFVMHFEVKE